MLISSRMEAVQSVLVVSGAVLSWNVRLVDERGRPSWLCRVVFRVVFDPLAGRYKKETPPVLRSHKTRFSRHLTVDDVIIRQVHPNRSARRHQVSFHRHLLHKHKEARGRSDGLHGIRTISYTQQHALSQCQVQ